MRSQHDDDATDRRLRLLVGLVVVSGAVCTIFMILYAIRHPPEMVNPAFLLAFVGCVAVANRVRVYVRIRSSIDSTTWGEVPVLICLALQPAPWVVLCSILAITILKTIERPGLQKTAFAIGKEALTAG